MFPFAQNTHAPVNRLPKDGIVNYYGKIFSQKEADSFLRILRESIAWKQDVAIIFGKKIITRRKVAWYADKAFEYTYSRHTKTALPWTKELLILKEITENKTGEIYNSCLLNLYHNGEEGMNWHSDDEKQLKKDAAIASLSFGAERKFAFKHKTTKATITIHLEHGSLLIMKGPTQTHWQHRLPKSKKITEPRINLTFRRMST